MQKRQMCILARPKMSIGAASPPMQSEPTHTLCDFPLQNQPCLVNDSSWNLETTIKYRCVWMRILNPECSRAPFSNMLAILKSIFLSSLRAVSQPFRENEETKIYIKLYGMYLQCRALMVSKRIGLDELDLAIANLDVKRGIKPITRQYCRCSVVHILGSLFAGASHLDDLWF
jgi:hypothetical protein